MNLLLVFQNPYEFFQFFCTFIKISFLNKDRANVILITWNILVCDLESCYKNKIRNVTFIFQNFQFFFKNVEKKLK